MTSLADLIKNKRQNTADKKAGNKNTYKFKQAKTTLRILPSWRKGDNKFFHEFGLSWIKDMDGNVLAAVGDAQVTYGDNDVLRGLIQKAMGEAKTDAQRQHFKDMIAKPRVLVNAQVLDDSSVDANVPEIIDFSEAQFDTILDQAQIAGIDADFLDLDKGYDLIVSKSGKGLSTSYSFTFARAARPVPQTIMEGVNDIDAFIRAKFAETERGVNALKSIMQGNAPLAITSQGHDYSGDSEPVYDAPWTAVDHEIHGEEAEVERRVVSDADLDSLFD